MGVAEFIDGEVYLYNNSSRYYLVRAKGIHGYYDRFIESPFGEFPKGVSCCNPSVPLRVTEIERIATKYEKEWVESVTKDGILPSHNMYIGTINVGSCNSFFDWVEERLDEIPFDVIITVGGSRTTLGELKIDFDHINSEENGIRKNSSRNI